MPIESIDAATDNFLSAIKASVEEENFGTNLMILVLGSPVFCQDIIRFVGMDQKGHPSDVTQQFIDRIAWGKPSEVIWKDTETGDVLHKGDSFTMFIEAQSRSTVFD